MLRFILIKFVFTIFILTNLFATNTSFVPLNNKQIAVQKEVLAKIKLRAQEVSHQVKDDLFNQVIKLGYKRNKLERALKYISEKAEITIQFNPRKKIVLNSQKLTLADLLISNPLYQNVYETNISGATSLKNLQSYLKNRNIWETKKLFFPELIQSDGINPIRFGAERPKYASLNIYNYQNSSIPQFGNCFFILSPSVKVNSSFSSGDTSFTKKMGITTFEFPENALYYKLFNDTFFELKNTAKKILHAKKLGLKLTEDEKNDLEEYEKMLKQIKIKLDKILAASEGKKLINNIKIKTKNYTEVQIIQDLLFNRDFKAIVIDKKTADNVILRNKLVEFAEKNSLPIFVFIVKEKNRVPLNDYLEEKQ